MKRKRSQEERKKDLALAWCECQFEVFAGFAAPAVVRGRIQDQLSCNGVPRAAEVAARFTHKQLRKHLAKQMQWWHKETDNDRLDRVFQELNENGISARQHYKCCRTCAERALLDKHHQTKWKVYFHAQDTARAINEQKLNLRAEAGGSEAEAWSHMEPVFKKHGFTLHGVEKVRWIHPFLWQRRRMCHILTCRENNKRATWPCFCAHRK